MSIVMSLYLVTMSCWIHDKMYLYVSLRALVCICGMYTFIAMMGMP
jgi:hypothetical protein